MAERYTGRRRAPGRHRTPRRPARGAARLLAAVGVAVAAATVLPVLPLGTPADVASGRGGPTSAGRGGPTSRPVAQASGRGGAALTGSGVVGQLPVTALLMTAVRMPAVRMTGVSREQERPGLRGCDGKASRLGHANGQIPVGELCELPFAAGQRLRADAAVSLSALDAAYSKAFGGDLCVSDSYRSLGSQQGLKARKPRLAARPGTSEHGWGVAVDLCGKAYGTGTTEHDWLLATARRFGWDNPAWARPNGSKPEPWHWEYVAGQG